MACPVILQSGCQFLRLADNPDIAHHPRCWNVVIDRKSIFKLLACLKIAETASGVEYARNANQVTLLASDRDLRERRRTKLVSGAGHVSRCLGMAEGRTSLSDRLWPQLGSGPPSIPQSPFAPSQPLANSTSAQMPGALVDEINGSWTALDPLVSANGKRLDEKSQRPGPKPRSA